MNLFDKANFNIASGVSATLKFNNSCNINNPTTISGFCLLAQQSIEPCCKRHSNRKRKIIDFENKNLTVDEPKLSIYPKPAANNITVEHGNEILEKISITDSYGKILLSKLFKNTSKQVLLDVSGYTSGFYFIEIQTENERHFEKFIINSKY